MVLIIEPANELRFRGPYDTQTTATIKMTNRTDRRIHFKLKTTAPKQYIVRPNSGTVPPNGAVEARIALLPFEYNAEECYRHKFMIQYITEPEGCALLPEQLWQEADVTAVEKYKLKCVFDNGNEMDSDGSVVDAAVGFEREIREELRKVVESTASVKAEMNALVKEKDALLEQHREMNQELARVKSLVKKSLNDSGFSIPLAVASLVFVVIVSYVFGKIF